jgi:spore coat polysaccharide biosynthesis protein SpsF
MKNIVIIQARMGSTRLPGKVLKVLINKTVLAHVVDRVQAVQSIDDIVIATTLASQDDSIIEEAKRLGVSYYRGSESDVLSRYYEAARQFRADSVVRVTSDCPLLDPGVSSMIVQEYLKADFDYVSNTLERTYPRGLDTEVMSFHSLETAHLEATTLYDREHVTPYIYNNRNKFACLSIAKQEISDYRWTLDTPEDWDLIEKIYKSLYQADRLFTWEEAVEVMKKNASWKLINSSIQQK